MEAYDFKGKTVIPFATSGGSSIKKACEDLKGTYPDVNWKEGQISESCIKERFGGLGEEITMKYPNKSKIPRQNQLALGFFSYLCRTNQ